jgi:hypothetical protein
VQLRSLIGGLEDEFFAPLDDTQRKTLHDLLVELARHNDPDCCPLEPDGSAA